MPDVVSEEERWDLTSDSAESDGESEEGSELNIDSDDGGADEGTDDDHAGAIAARLRELESGGGAGRRARGAKRGRGGGEDEEAPQEPVSAYLGGSMMSRVVRPNLIAFEEGEPERNPNEGLVEATDEEEEDGMEEAGHGAQAGRPPSSAYEVEEARRSMLSEVPAQRQLREVASGAQNMRPPCWWCQYGDPSRRGEEKAMDAFHRIYEKYVNTMEETQLAWAMYFAWKSLFRAPDQVEQHQDDPRWSPVIDMEPRDFLIHIMSHESDPRIIQGELARDMRDLLRATFSECIARVETQMPDGNVHQADRLNPAMVSQFRMLVRDFTVLVKTDFSSAYGVSKGSTYSQRGRGLGDWVSLKRDFVEPEPPAKRQRGARDRNNRY